MCKETLRVMVDDEVSYSLHFSIQTCHGCRTELTLMRDFKHVPRVAQFKKKRSIELILYARRDLVLDKNYSKKFHFYMLIY